MEQNRPNQDTDPEITDTDEPRRAPGGEPRGVQKHIADADKVARTGKQDEPVRNTPPSGEWNDTSPD
jgi:hypothetical protein